MGDPIKDMKFFQKFGFEQYVLCSEDCAGFFNWFSQNITNDNILTDMEIGEYECLKNENLIVTGQELEEQLNELNANYPNILNCTENDLKQYEEKLDHLVSIEEQYELLLERTKIAQINSFKTLNTLQLECEQIEQEEQSQINKCFEYGKQLQDLQLNNQKQLLELNQCYKKTQIAPLFIYQMPLNQYFQKCEQIAKTLEIYFQQNFKIQNFFEPNPDDDSNNNIMKMSKSLEKVKTMFHRNHSQILDLNIEINGIRAMNGSIRNSNDIKVMSWAALRDTNEKHQEHMKILSMQIDSSRSIIIQQLQKLAEQEAEFIVYQNNCEKLQRATIRLDYLRKFSEIVSNSLLNADILWIVMQLDMELIKEKNDCHKLDEYRTEAQLCMKRMDTMNQIIKAPSSNTFNELVLKEFSKILSNASDIPESKLCDIQSCLLEYEKMTKLSETSLQEILEGSQTNQIMNELKSIEDQLNECVMDGPVNKPNLTNIQFLEDIFKLQKENELIESKLKDVRRDIQNYTNKNKDKIWRHYQLLWIYFLSEPKKILKALKEVSAEVNATATKNTNLSETSFKPIAGIKRKQ